jgi:hypothetical protein
MADAGSETHKSFDIPFESLELGTAPTEILIITLHPAVGE